MPSPLAVPLALDPLDVLARLAGEPGCVLLRLPDPRHPVTLVGCRPIAELRLPPTHGDPLAALAGFVRETPAAGGALPFPLGGGIVTCLAYELGLAIAPRPIVSAGCAATAILRRYDPLLVLDHRRARWSIVGTGRRLPPWLDRLHDPAPVAPALPPAGPLSATWPADRHGEAVRRILACLAAGDCYQVNLTQAFTAPLPWPPWVLFQRLSRRHPAPFAAYLDLGDAVVVGNSPELLLRRRGALVETRPIKGTRPRGTTPAGDRRLRAELAGDAKERAEHVMIVDLERNDLGRVCRTGSVAVPALAEVDTHPSLHHLVSRVTGLLRDDVDLPALLAATFPGGSITGAPKLRAMEIIAELEHGPRGVYTGALGLIAPGGDLELGLPIRTGVVAGGVVRWHAGGGIVADSDPERELAEAWLKTEALRAALADAVPGATACSSG